MRESRRSSKTATELRHRAVSLLESFFARDDRRTRRLVFDDAFDGCDPNPANQIEYEGGVEVFAKDAVGRLLAFGCVTRGKHALALLLETMAAARGRQPHPDYCELPAILNLEFGLPTRVEEVEYLGRLIAQIEAKARIYSPLAGKADSRPKPGALDPWADDPALELLIRHRSRKNEACEPALFREYTDILAAFPR